MYTCENIKNTAEKYKQYKQINKQKCNSKPAITPPAINHHFWIKCTSLEIPKMQRKNTKKWTNTKGEHLNLWQQQFHCWISTSLPIYRLVLLLVLNHFPVPVRAFSWVKYPGVEMRAAAKCPLKLGLAPDWRQFYQQVGQVFLPNVWGGSEWASMRLQSKIQNHEIWN